ncbi:hypothetical protein HMPREF3033_01710 [Veillonellaceae bacterium DNF00751]|nr:hypothetical protein HMPREF3033_01710 [Veillonellaceae bacterium DNF00751]
MKTRSFSLRFVFYPYIREKGKRRKISNKINIKKGKEEHI